jgi:hypothetical protein
MTPGSTRENQDHLPKLVPGSEMKIYAQKNWSGLEEMEGVVESRMKKHSA